MTDPCFICIDLGGTKIKMALVKQGAVIASAVTDAHNKQGLKERLPVVKHIIDGMLLEQEILFDEVSAVCVSVPGIVDTVEKRVLSIDQKYADAPSINFREWADACWQVPLYMDNDARCAMIGEWQYGAAKGYEDAAIMTLGTGIGSSAIMQGNIVRGKHFMAGILGGHSTINLDGEVCNCGNMGCGETVIATWNLAAKVKQHNGYQKSALQNESLLDFETIFRLADSDELAQTLLERALQVWNVCAVNLIHAYDPEVLVLTGGIMQSADIIVPAMQDYINKHAWTPWGQVQVVKAKHINTASLLGAACLINLS